MTFASTESSRISDLHKEFLFLFFLSVDGSSKMNRLICQEELNIQLLDQIFAEEKANNAAFE